MWNAVLDEIEVTEFFEFHHIRCVVFGHNFKVDEQRMDINDNYTDDVEDSRLIDRLYQCKTCGGWIYEFYPKNRASKIELFGSVE